MKWGISFNINMRFVFRGKNTKVDDAEKEVG